MNREQPPPLTQEQTGNSQAPARLSKNPTTGAPENDPLSGTKRQSKLETTSQSNIRGSKNEPAQNAPQENKGPEKKVSLKGKKKLDSKKNPQRQYLYFEDANEIEWRKDMEYQGYEKWRTKFGPGTEWWDRYEEWICSGMTRGVMRKPSYRSVEWVKYQRGIEVAPVGECCTRTRTRARDYFVEPIDNYCCRPCPWPKVTSAEVGWLGQHKSCQLEIYPNDFMKKPPMPWWDRKISTFLPGTM